MKKVSLLLTLLVLSVVAFSQIKKRKILIIGIDGCKASSLKKVMEDGNAPNMQGLLQKGTYTWDGLTLHPTWSATGWASLLTGVMSDKHRSVENTFTGNNLANYPSFLQHIGQTDKNKFTSVFSTWASIPDVVVGEACVNIVNGRGLGETHAVRDAKGRDSIVHILQYGFTDVVFSQFDNVDHEGHTVGFNETQTAYYNAIVGIDNYVGDFITAINNRPTKAQEDWLYVICTDHGGNGGSGHGSNSYNERNVFFIVSDNDNSGTPTDLVASAQIKRDTVTTTMPATNYRAGGGLAQSANTAYGFGTTQDFTIEMRVRRSGTIQDRVFVGNKNWSSGLNKGWTIAGASGNNHSWKFNMGSGSSRLDMDGGRIDDNNWHHIAVTVDRDGRKATYQDGELVAVNNVVFNNDITTTFALALGCDVNDAFIAGADFAEVRIWKKALTQQEIETWQSQTLNNTHPQYADLVNYYPLTETTGTVLNDNGPTPNNMTVTPINSTSWITQSGTPFLQYNPAKVRSDANYSFTGTENFTVETWVKVGNWVNNDGVIVSDKNWGSGANKGWVIATVPGQNYWKFNIGSGAGGTGRIDLNGGTINDNVWHHIAVTVNRSGDIVLYQDGVEVRRRVNMHLTSTGVTNSIPTATNIAVAKKLGIGVDGDGAFPYSAGLIAETRIFNVEVSATNINTYKGTATTALSTSHPNKANLQYYYPGHEGTGLVYNDISHTASYRNSGAAKNASIIDFQTTTGQSWYANTANLNTFSYLANGVPTNQDLALTTFKWLGINVNPAWNLDGKPIAVPAVSNSVTPATDVQVVAPNTTTTINVLSNDTDPQGDILSIEGIENPATPGVYTLSLFAVQGQKPDGSFVAAGTVSANTNGNVEFIANNTFAGIVKLNYKAVDNNVAPANAIATLNIVVSSDVNTTTDISASAGSAPTTYANGTVNVTYSLVDPNGLQTGNTVVNNIQSQSTVTNNLAAGLPSQKSTIKINFSKPVYNLQFSVMGIDEINSKEKANAKGDFVTVRASSTSSFTESDLVQGEFVTGDSVMYLGDNTFMPKSTKNIALGSYSAIDAATSTVGNANFTFAGPIVQVEVDLSHIPWQTGTTQSHGVYIASMNFVEALNSLIVPIKNLRIFGKNNVHSNDIKWEATSEQEVLYYTIEKSNDGISFTSIKQVSALKNVSTQTYNYTDNQDVNGTRYYRIKALESNGKVYYSQIISLNNKQSNNVVLLSNPVDNAIQLKVNGLKTGNYATSITNLAGQLVQKGNLSINSNNQYTLFLNSTLANGQYVLELNNGVEKWAVKFIKK